MTTLSHELSTDEAFNWFVSKDGLFTAVDRIHADFFPPLYSAVLALWMELVPAGDIALRIPSIVAGLLTILFTYLLLARAAGARAALVGALLVALSPLQATWSQSVRAFAFEGMFITAFLYFAYRVATLEKGTAKGQFSAFVGLFISLLGAAYSSHGALFIIFLSCPCLMLAAWSRGWSLRSPFTLKVLGTYALVFLCWLPELPFILDQIGRSHDLAVTVHRPDAGQMLYEAVTFMGVSLVWTLQPVGVLLVGVPAALGAFWLYRHARAGFYLLVGASFFYLACMLALYFIVDPLFGRVVERGVWMNVLMLMLAAIGYAWATHELPKILPAIISEKLWRFGAYAVLVLVVLLELRGLDNLHRAHTDHWKILPDLIGDRVEPGDYAVTIPWLSHGSLVYYMPEQFPEDHVDVAQRPFQWGQHDMNDVIAEMRERYAGKGTRFWVFVGGNVTDEMIEPFRAEILEHIVPPAGEMAIFRFGLEGGDNN
ncbi:glycosyltransferase family 39 protein [Kordiimonas sp.]|uniref:glycosyltransferase family 39 protein n=1 Tax=Kordiimonas sp. TaxID=1970157 RepID=UPI003A92CB25